jgi:hypothetical protein
MREPEAEALPVADEISMLIDWAQKVLSARADVIIKAIRQIDPNKGEYACYILDYALEHRQDGEPEAEIGVEAEEISALVDCVRMLFRFPSHVIDRAILHVELTLSAKFQPIATILAYALEGVEEDEDEECWDNIQDQLETMFGGRGESSGVQPA